ncbi:hypothetical protein [Azospirillum sp. ST 5-10]|uniref:hypothetical protein n=1 Tax=unclassified Azospirillum TaxID=2630922 RepID=UPI003F4A49AE
MSGHHTSGLAFLALAVGVAGSAALVALGAGAPRPAAAAYLTALAVWSAVPAGALALLMAARLFGGRWVLVVDRPLVGAGRTLVPTALLFVPLVLLLEPLYPWAAAGWREANPLRAVYLNEPFFTVRTAAIVLLWVACFVWLRRSDARTPAALGLVVYGLTASFAGVDWLMSRDPAFNSAEFGLYFIAHQLLAAYAFAMLAARLDHATPHQLRSLAGLLLAGALAWSYLAYMQYLVVWSGNLPEEAAWYLRRQGAGWDAAFWAVALLQAVLPILALPLPAVQRSPAALKALAAGVLLARVIEAAWLVLPDGPATAAPLLLTATALAALGGLWLALFLALRRV